MGWLFTMFDLPVVTKEDRVLASSFRNHLIDEGFLMMQYSVYVRPCVTHEHIEKHVSRIKSKAPNGGRIKIFFITDNQWTKSINIEDPSYRPTDEIEMPEQFAFW